MISRTHFTFISLVTLGITLTSSPAIANLPGAAGAVKNLAPVQNWRSKVKGKNVRLADGMQFKVHDYMNMTSFRQSPKLKRVFSPQFQQRFLKRPVQYTEDVQTLPDRLVVNRTMLVDLKNPCDANVAKAGLNVCFKRKAGKPLNQKIKDDLNKTRGKMRSWLAKNSKHKDAAKYRNMLNMSDDQLLDQLLNKQQTTKIIKHESVVPLAAYQFRRIPNFSPLDRNIPVPRRDMITKIEQAATAFKLSRPVNNNQPQTRRRDMNSQVRGQTNIMAHKETFETAAAAAANRPAPGPYRFNSSSNTVRNMVMGWTYGRRFGDKYEVEFAGETWLTDRYYAFFKYQVSAGFGLRFPFQVNMSSQITKVEDENGNLVNYPANTLCHGNFSRRGRDAQINDKYCARQAEITVTAKPVAVEDSDSTFYQRAEMPSAQIFDGKEFVFELGVTCRLYASIPGDNFNRRCPRSWDVFDFGQHFTPQIGSEKTDLLKHSFSGRALGLALDAGIGYAALNPGVTLTARDGYIDFLPRGIRSSVLYNKNRVRANPTDKFHVEVNNTVGEWGAKIKKPSYTFTAGLAPTLEVEIGIDLGLYDWNTTFGPYSIDALELTLGSPSFDRHEGSRKEMEIKKVGVMPPRS